MIQYDKYTLIKVCRRIIFTLYFLNLELIIVIQPAKTGKERINNKEVKKIDQGNKGKNKERFEAFNKETIKLIEPNKEESPTKCNEKIIKSKEE